MVNNNQLTATPANKPVIALGKMNLLTIIKEVDFGLYLDAGDAGEILLPKRYVPQQYNMGDKISVFIYLDQEERLVATTEKPLAMVGDFACLKCSWVNEYGAFLHWGPMKDVFCSFREQKKHMEIGNYYIVYIYVDEESYRIAASAKIERFLSNHVPMYAIGTEVDVLIWQKTELGFKVIINNQYAGLVYQNQVFKRITTGDCMKGYIQNIRPDGKIDISLQPLGRQQTKDFAEILLNYLHDNNGFCDLGDKSDAQDIQYRFQVSKKTYKKAIGDLYKRRLITIEENGIRLVRC